MFCYTQIYPVSWNDRGIMNTAGVSVQTTFTQRDAFHSSGHSWLCWLAGRPGNASQTGTFITGFWSKHVKNHHHKLPIPSGKNLDIAIEHGPVEMVSVPNNTRLWIFQWFCERLPEGIHWLLNNVDFPLISHIFARGNCVDPYEQPSKMLWSVIYDWFIWTQSIFIYIDHWELTDKSLINHW